MLKNSIKLNVQIKYLAILSLLIFIKFSCPEADTDYYIKNSSSDDIKVLLIDKERNDTIRKLIFEQETKYMIISIPFIEWYNPSDSLQYGYDLIITQNDKNYNKDFRNNTSWSYEKNKNDTKILIIYNEDF